MLRTTNNVLGEKDQPRSMRMTTLLSHVIPDAQSFQVILDSFPLQQYVCSHPQSDNNPPHVKSAFILLM